jgi:hypothetical protein
MTESGKSIAVLVVALVLGGGIWAWSQASGDEDPARAVDGPVVYVLKTAACGCCTAWVEHMRDEGFRVETEDVSAPELVEAKHERGVPRDLFACHTARVEGYVVEGHVPADEVRRLLKEEPDVTGLAVAGMPVGSPGMEVGDRQEPYDVVAFEADGQRSVFAAY